MTRNAFLLCLASALIAGGCSAIVSSELDDKPECLEAEFCQGKDDGTDCSDSSLPNHICVDFCCVERRCGDGYTDTTASPPEECDDGNTMDGDGCDSDCTFTCTEDTDCEDGDPCNGTMVCDESSHRCNLDGNPLPSEGSACTANTGDGGVVVGECMDDECVEI